MELMSGVWFCFRETLSPSQPSRIIPTAGEIGNIRHILLHFTFDTKSRLLFKALKY